MDNDCAKQVKPVAEKQEWETPAIITLSTQQTYGKPGGGGEATSTFGYQYGAS